jgi:hypothetical protein
MDRRFCYFIKLLACQQPHARPSEHFRDELDAWAFQTQRGRFEREAMGGCFEPGAAGGAVSSRRKTTRAVIRRTIIDGTTHIKGILRLERVFDGKLATGLTGRALSGFRELSQLVSPRRHQSRHHRPRDVGPNISSKLR